MEGLQFCQSLGDECSRLPVWEVWGSSWGPLCSVSSSTSGDAEGTSLGELREDQVPAPGTSYVLRECCLFFLDDHDNGRLFSPVLTTAV